ncbi:MAG TPA: DUF4836 family protein [Chitinophaga sp.]|uniref:DUF4836 family protein n=1 Tax=Chitinophaga sp. TaxID=1869181 RepID=UPI002C83CA97|nr:DUF4836 family protein [Chitinophaga sp.]HVI45934.1 DUF4836 family protein [Chitinophaga sp.]
MKRTISKVLLTAVSAAVILSACSKVPDESKHIPKTAGVILELNAKEITQKLVTSGLTMDKVFTSLQSKDTANEVMKSWKDAENSGVDLKGHFFASFIFQEKRSYISLTGSLQDADKFEAYLKKNIADFSLKTQNDFKYIWESKEGAVIAWNKNTVISIYGYDTDNLNKLPSAIPGVPGAPGPDDSDATEVAADSAAATPAALVTASNDDAAKELVTEVDHLFHLKKEETAGSLEPFAKLLKENSDMSVFVNPEAIYNSGQFTMIPANFKKLMDGAFYTATVNFEKGKVVMNGNSYMGKEMATIYKKYGKKEIDIESLKKYPSENVTGFISYAFDLHMIAEIIKSTGMDGLVNMFLAKSSLSLDDIVNAFDGQFTYIASDFAVTKKESPYFPGEFKDEPSAKWIFNMKVGNKDAFNKVMTSPMLKDIFTKEGDRYVISSPAVAAGVPPVSITEKNITVGSDSVLLQQYLAGKGSIKLPEGLESKIKGSMLGGYADLEKVINTIPADKADSDEGKAMMAKVKGLLKDFTIVGQPYSGDVQRSEAVLTLKNKDENSLVQLINFATEMSKLDQAKKAKQKAAEDSLFAVPVDSAAAADAVVSPAH